jgi:hypothetical protein
MPKITQARFLVWHRRFCQFICLTIFMGAIIVGSDLSEAPFGFRYLPLAVAGIAIGAAMWTLEARMAPIVGGLLVASSALYVMYIFLLRPGLP